MLCVVVGGSSVSELFPNFAETPIYLIEKSNPQIITRILPNKNNLCKPGLIFDHQLKILKDGSMLSIEGGIKYNNYLGGISIKETNNIEKIELKNNADIFWFDFKKKEWNILLDKINI